LRLKLSRQRARRATKKNPRSFICKHCGKTNEIPTQWETDPETAETGANDPDNTGDCPEIPNATSIRKLAGAAVRNYVIGYLTGDRD
jgi:hypothetical protein